MYFRGTLILCGPGKTILNTWRVLDGRRFEVIIVSTRPGRGERNAFLDAAAALHAPYRELTIGRGVDLKAVWRLVQMIREERIDILQTHDSETRRIGILAAALAGVPHVTSVHGYICNDRKERIVRWIDHQVLRRIAHVITVSGRLRQDLLDAGVKPERITLLQNAVMLSDYPAPGDGAALRIEFRIPRQAPVVSIIGRLSAEKGHEDFLKAALIVLKTLPDTRFLIVGEGPLRGLLERRVTELHLSERVFLTGHRSDLAELYGLTDVLAISSYHRRHSERPPRGVCLRQAGGGHGGWRRAGGPGRWADRLPRTPRRTRAAGPTPDHSARERHAAAGNGTCRQARGRGALQFRRADQGAPAALRGAGHAGGRTLV